MMGWTVFYRHEVLLRSRCKSENSRYRALQYGKPEEPLGLLVEIRLSSTKVKIIDFFK